MNKFKKNTIPTELNQAVPLEGLDKDKMKMEEWNGSLEDVLAVATAHFFSETHKVLITFSEMPSCQHKSLVKTAADKTFQLWNKWRNNGVSAVDALVAIKKTIGTLQMTIKKRELNRVAPIKVKTGTQKKSTPPR